MDPNYDGTNFKPEIEVYFGWGLCWNQPVVLFKSRLLFFWKGKGHGYLRGPLMKKRKVWKGKRTTSRLPEIPRSVL